MDLPRQVDRTFWQLKLIGDFFWFNFMVYGVAFPSYLYVQTMVPWGVDMNLSSSWNKSNAYE
jgi:hypothetical protein